VATPLERWLIGATVGIGAWAAVHLNGRIDALDDRLRVLESKPSAVAGDVSRIDRRLDGCENTLGTLREFLYARPRAQAASLGLQDASIQPVSLRKGEQFIPRERLTREQSDALRYTFLDITETSARLRVDGMVGTNTLENVQIVFPLTPGAATRIPFPIDFGVKIPDLYITVLERPSPHFAMIAVGTRAGPEQKSGG